MRNLLAFAIKRPSSPKRDIPTSMNQNKLRCYYLSQMAKDNISHRNTFQWPACLFTRANLL